MTNERFFPRFETEAVWLAVLILVLMGAAFRVKAIHAEFFVVIWEVKQAAVPKFPCPLYTSSRKMLGDRA